MTTPDAVIVGSGPNGLAAAVTMARAGLDVVVYEGDDDPGGGCRTAERTLPDFLHDVCSTVHPLVAASPFFRGEAAPRSMPSLLVPGVQFAHPLDGGRAGVVWRSVDQTASELGSDADPYQRLVAPIVRQGDAIAAAFLAPLRSIPPHPVATARFGLLGLLPVTQLARRLHTEEARAILAGAAAHSMLPLGSPLTGAYALFLTMLAHHVGWPVVEGGSQRIVDALVAELTSLGGTVVTGQWVKSLDELPRSRATLLDVTPRQLIALAGEDLAKREQRQLAHFRYGPGICKVDWALAGPVPWTATRCRETATVHVGGTLAEIVRGEAEVARGRHPDRPFCIVVQPCVVDPSRAPSGRHVLWGYCHVPAGSSIDMTEAIERQIERFAPGFRDLVLSRATTTAEAMERYNPNYVGGDITAGAATLRQTIFRPTVHWNPYRTTIPGVYLCSASTPPGGGVHGMCGYEAARTAIRDLNSHRGGRYDRP